jgi:hypothetical protein
MSRELLITGVKVEVTHTANWVMLKFHSVDIESGNPAYVLDILKLEDAKKLVDAIVVVSERAFSDPPQQTNSL